MNRLSEKKEEILSSLLRLLVILGGIAYVPSMVACLRDGLYALAVIDTLAYAAIASVVFFKGFHYLTRLRVTVFTTLFVGGAVLFLTGNDGAGHLWLICGVVISALFGTFRIVILTISLAESIMVVYGVLISAGLIVSSVSMVSLIAIAANLLAISITLSLITHKLLQALDKELEVKEDLLRLMHHRVKNNLQTVESLIALDHDSERPGDSSRLSRRVSAVSTANHMLLTDHGKPAVELGELVGAFLRPGLDRMEGGDSRLIQPERVSELAILLSDLFAFLQPAGPLVIEFPGDLPGCHILVRPSNRTAWDPGLKEQLEHTLLSMDDLELSFRPGECRVCLPGF